MIPFILTLTAIAILGVAVKIPKHLNTYQYLKEINESYSNEEED